jgi:hypothetical protein
MAAKLNDLTGRRFGRWTVIRRWGSKTYRYEDGSVVVPLWLCRCDCGGEGVVDGGNLKNGHSKSCGCLRLDWLEERRKGAGNGKKN